MKTNQIHKFALAGFIVAATLMAPGSFAAQILEVEPNDTYALAQNVDAGIGYHGYQYGVENSDTWQWVSINGGGDEIKSFDYYSFTVPTGGAQAIFDIDYTNFDTGTLIRLYNGSGSFLGGIGAGGQLDEGSQEGESSSMARDSLLRRTNSPLPAGNYFIRVERYANVQLQPGDKYTLNISMLPAIQPLVAEAGDGFSVNEGDSVTLDGSGSSGAAPLTFSWTQLPGGTQVALAGAGTQFPAFIAPEVANGGETLSFQLSVSSGTSVETDTVDVTIVNQNHPPVADAGDTQSVAEGAPVTLYGQHSFDIDNDTFSYAWTQIGGPTVSLTGADGPNPTFEAPYGGINGEVGLVATLTFQLLVDDGYAFDVPAPGYTFDNVIDTVTVEITNTNNLPIADAGDDQTVDENTLVSLSGLGSSDPDGDSLTYSWFQESGSIPVVLIGADTATPSFAAPSVNGTTTLDFTLTVDDGYGGSASDTVTVNVLNSTSPPLADAAEPTIDVLWPPNHQMVEVGITGVTAEDNSVSIQITGVTQDEPTNAKGDGDTPIDAIINTDGTVLIRSERSGKGNGRVYHIHFTATNSGGSTSGSVEVSVPKSKKKAAVDGGELFDSTQ